MVRLTTMFGVAAVVALAACGGGSPDPAAAECEALFDRVCVRVVECGFLGLDADACADMVQEGLPQGGCDDADQVGATYDTCMADMLSIPCADLFPDGNRIALPLDCENVILFEP